MERERTVEERAITEWRPAGSIIYTRFGNLSYRAWLETELKRINKFDATLVKIEERVDGQICLADVH